MTVTLTHEEMLAQWKLRRALLPLRLDCEVTRRDTVDVDRLAALEMRDWYLRLLDTAPVELTGVTDLAGEVAVTAVDDGTATVVLPPGCRRVVSVEMEGWERPATVVADPASPVARLQTSRYSRGGAARPVAVVEGDTLRLYTPVNASARLVSLKCVTEPADGSYRMDERALSLITPYPSTPLTAINQKQ